MKIPRNKSPDPFNRKEQSMRVAWDAIGIAIFDGDRIAGRVRWSEVKEVFAFKEDRGTCDDICLGFAVDEKGTFWTVSEEFFGYKPLLCELERRFPGMVTDWFSDVAFPAFSTNRKTLWKKSQQSTGK